MRATYVKAIDAEVLGVSANVKSLKVASDPVRRPMADPVMVDIARDLRQRQTAAEQVLWEALRGRRLDGIKFRRQHPIENTAYVVDFLCYESRLVVEIDGGIHDTQVQDDAIRQANIEAQGYRVIRFRNKAVQADLPGVLAAIRGAVRGE